MPRVTVTPTTGPAPLEDRTVPSVKDIDFSALANPNRPVTALSTLCWARQETVLALLRVLEQQIDGRGTEMSYRRQMMAAVDGVRDHVEQLEAAALSAPIDAFAATFQQDLAAATMANVLPDETLLLFNFERYPGIRAYVAAARSEPGCVEP
jgi:hypothetical protein